MPCGEDNPDKYKSLLGFLNSRNYVVYSVAVLRKSY